MPFPATSPTWTTFPTNFCAGNYDFTDDFPHTKLDMECGAFTDAFTGAFPYLLETSIGYGV